MPNIDCIARETWSNNRRESQKKYFQFQIYTILKYMAFNSTGRKQCEQENGTFNLIIEDFSNLVQDMKYFLSN